MNHLFKLLASNAYVAYRASLSAAINGESRMFDWFKQVEVGQLVMEVSTIGMDTNDSTRIGYLKKVENRKRKGITYTIELLDGGRKFEWTNASFIRVPEDFNVFSTY